MIGPAPADGATMEPSNGRVDAVSAKQMPTPQGN